MGEQIRNRKKGLAQGIGENQITGKGKKCGGEASTRSGKEDNKESRGDPLFRLLGVGEGGGERAEGDNYPIKNTRGGGIIIHDGP